MTISNSEFGHTYLHSPSNEMKFMIHNIIFPLTCLDSNVLNMSCQIIQLCNILSQIVHCIYHNVHFVWIDGENEICVSAPNLWQDKQFFEYIHPSSGILYEYEQWIWLFFILYFYSIVFDLFWFYQFFSQFRHAEGFSQFRHYKLRFYWRSLKQLWYH